MKAEWQYWAEYNDAQHEPSDANLNALCARAMRGGRMTDEAKPYKWEQDARANNAEAAVLFERARALAAEAQRDRLTAALRGVMLAEEGIEALPRLAPAVMVQLATERVDAAWAEARAALADVREEE